jgi:hypothetical protein
MLDMKIVVVLFCAAIKESGFPVTPLLDVLMELRESYQQLLLTQWNKKFKEILTKDNYTPMIIEDETQYQLLLRQFPLRIEATEKVWFRIQTFSFREKKISFSYHFHVLYHIVNLYRKYS